MSLFSKFQKTNKELEPLVMAVANNAANNYKDAAQKAKFAMELKHFHH